MAQHSLVISLPFRQSSSVDFEDKIKHYIETRYGQQFGDYAADAKSLEKMRALAIQATDPHVSAIEKLQKYAAQLVWMEARFPIDLGVEFTWYSSLGYNTSKPNSHATLRFDLVNILYNLAALYSHLGCSTRQDSDGLKSACNYFSLAAGILKHLQSTLVPEMRSAPPADMDPWTLESLENLMLAQAQECFWQKAIMDGRLKDASIGKMAAAVADLYASAADLGTKSDGIRSEWLHHMKARHYHFMAAASYRISRDCLENRQYGDEVARLQDGLDCVRKGLSESRYINNAVVADLEALEEKLADDLKRAEKDNDKLYYMRVPPKSELKTIDKLRMVNSKITPEILNPLSLLGENSELGPRLFENLVPYAVHEAQAKYEAAKTEKINKTINQDIERLNQIMQDMLKSLDLPGALMAVQQPLGVPEDLIHRAEELRQQKAPHLLQTLSQSVESMKGNGQEMFLSAVQTLRAEADEDQQARMKFGTDRWNRPNSEQANPELWGQIKQLEGWLEHARSSDALIAKKMADSEKLIILLSGPIRDLEQYVPSSADVALSPPLSQAVFELQNCFSEWHRMLRRRLRKIEDVRIKAREDSIYPLLVREATRLESESVTRRVTVDQLTILFGKCLAAYDSDQNLVREEEQSQEQLIEKFKRAHDQFVAARKGDTSSNRRAQALQSLDKAYLNYKKIISNLEGAKKFYKDFLVTVGKFRDDCQAYTYKRRAEAAHMYTELAPDISTLNISNAAALREQKEAEAKSSKPKAPEGEPLVAPLPTRATGPAGGMWDPSRGISFGATGAAGQGQQTGGGQQQKDAPAPPKIGGWDPSQGIKFN